MAQRTAFLNSDAKGYNKDFHHTWISNYMLKQPGVMFSNYSTKPEFALGNGQISGGKAIIRCTRTTGTFAGEEILACFESTSTENISTSGNKKVFIEIPQVYVNDSTAITDDLTGGANLGVGRIVSDTDYPSHTNYIPLWEISNGDWQNATDVRPEVLRRGKPNTISYFGGNGEEERIDIDNSSLNKYLMSNGAGVAPSWEEGGGGGGGGSSENFKRVFTADSDLLAKSMFGVALISPTSDSDDYIDFGRETVQDVFFKVVLNGETFDSVTLKLGANNSPADNVTVRIETLDSNGMPSGTLVDVGAYGTVTPSSSLGNVTVNLSGTVSGLSAHTKVAVVLSRSGSYSDSNSFRLGVINKTNIITQIYVSYEGSYSSWSGTSGCIDCDGFASDAVVQATSLNGVEWIGYCETGAVAGNDFTGILQGTVDYTGAKAGSNYYISNTGTLTTTVGTQLVGKGLESNLLQIGISTGGSKGSYDAIVASDGSGDYTTIGAAVNAGNQNIFVKNGSYTETEGWNAYSKSNNILHIIGESKSGVQVTIPENISTTNGYVIDMRYNNSADFYMENITFNITLSSTNKIFYIDNGGTNFYVKNCSFTYTTTNTGGGATANNMFYTKIIGDGSSFSNMPFGFYDCYFTTETTYIINLAYKNLYAYGCYFYSEAGRIQLAQMNYQSILRKCVINTFALGGTYDMVIFDSNITVGNENGGHIYSHNYNQLHIAMISDSVFTLGTLTETPEIELGVCLNSNLGFGSYAIAGTGDYNSNRAICNSHIVCGAISGVSNMTGCDVSGTSITLVARGRVIGNVFGTTLTTITCSSADSILSGNVFRGTGTFTLSGTRDIITSNNMRSIALTDTGTDNVKANNISAS